LRYAKDAHPKVSNQLYAFYAINKETQVLKADVVKRSFFRSW